MLRYLSQCVEIRAKSEELVELLNEIVILLLAFWFFHTAGSDSVELRCLTKPKTREFDKVTTNVARALETRELVHRTCKYCSGFCFWNILAKTQRTRLSLYKNENVR